MVLVATERSASQNDSVLPVSENGRPLEKPSSRMARKRRSVRKPMPHRLQVALRQGKRYLEAHVTAVPYCVHRSGRLRRHDAAAALLRQAFWRLAQRGQPAVRDLFDRAVHCFAAVGAAVRPDRAQAGADGKPRRVGRLLRGSGTGNVPARAVRGAAAGGSDGGQYLDRHGLYRRHHHA